MMIVLSMDEYHELLRKAQLFEELGEPDTVEELVGKIQILEDRLRSGDHNWVVSSTAIRGEFGDSFGDPFKEY